LIFLLDATFAPQLARALQELDQEDCEFRHSSIVFGQEAPDELIFKGIKERGWFLVTLDARMSKRPAQKEAIIESGIGAFVFRGTSLPQRSFRKIAAFVLDVSDDIIEKAAGTTRPFIWGISDRRVFERLDSA